MRESFNGIKEKKKKKCFVAYGSLLYSDLKVKKLQFRRFILTFSSSKEKKLKYRICNVNI